MGNNTSEDHELIGTSKEHKLLICAQKFTIEASIDKIEKLSSKYDYMITFHECGNMYVKDTYHDDSNHENHFYSIEKLGRRCEKNKVGTYCVEYVHDNDEKIITNVSFCKTYNICVNVVDVLMCTTVHKDILGKYSELCVDGVGGHFIFKLKDHLIYTDAIGKRCTIFFRKCYLTDVFITEGLNYI